MSISLICKKVDINRQQFNAYLNGGRVPSHFNLKKLCDFFGVEEHEFDLHHAEFVELVSGRRGRQIVPDAVAKAYFQIVVSQTASLEKYEGYYYCYSYSSTSPGFVNRSLVAIRKSGNQYVARTFERFAPVAQGSRHQRAAFFKRRGLFFLNTSRLFLVDYETTENFTPATTVLMPTTRNAFTFLQGLRIDISSGTMQRPFSARVAMEALGKTPNLRAALKGTGLMHEDSLEIVTEIRSLISNSLTPGSRVLTVGV